MTRIPKILACDVNFANRTLLHYLRALSRRSHMWMCVREAELTANVVCSIAIPIKAPDFLRLCIKVRRGNNKFCYAAE